MQSVQIVKTGPKFHFHQICHHPCFCPVINFPSSWKSTFRLVSNQLSIDSNSNLCFFCFGSTFHMFLCPRIVFFFLWFFFSHNFYLLTFLNLLWNQLPGTVCFGKIFPITFLSSICPRIVHFFGACSNLRSPTGNLFALSTLSSLTYLPLHICIYQVSSITISSKISNIIHRWHLVVSHVLSWIYTLPQNSVGVQKL